MTVKTEQQESVISLRANDAQISFPWCAASLTLFRCLSYPKPPMMRAVVLRMLDRQEMRCVWKVTD